MKILDFIINFATRGSSSTVNAADRIRTKLEESDRMARRLAHSVGGGLREAFMSLPGAQFISNPIVALSAGIGTVASLGMQAEKTAKSFDVLVGSTSQSSKMLDEINKYADNTLWSRMDATQAAQSLLAYSIPAEKVVGDLKMLGDISLGDKNKLSTLASVFGQISTAGKLLTQDYKQLLNVGFNPLYDLSQMTGKSMATLQEEMSKGQISFEMFEQAVVHATSAGGKYYGMIDSLASTTSGSFEQVKGSVTATLLEIYELLQPMIASVLQGVNKVLNAVKDFIPQLKEVLPVVASFAAGIAVYSAAVLFAEKAQRLLNLAVRANPMLLVLGLLGVAFGECWRKSEKFRAGMKTVWDTVKGVGDAIKTFFLDRLAAVQKRIEAIVKLFKGDFKGALNSVKEAASHNPVSSAVKAGGGLKKVFGGVKGNYKSRLADEQAKAAEKSKGVSTPGISGVVETPDLGPAKYDTDGGGSAETITSGGTRTTSIKMTISKFFDNMNITMESAEDTGELQDRVVECMNRALEIALSASR